MADNDKGESFFRKVVRFVANPATDWADLNSRQEDSKELELEKSELKAMIERKRRNDFVRKREFDLLRRVRREGLTLDQLATLGTTSRLDNSEARVDEVTPRPDGVKAKIDEIEQQMVGEGESGGPLRSRSPSAPNGGPSGSVGPGRPAPPGGIEWGREPPPGPYGPRPASGFDRPLPVAPPRSPSLGPGEPGSPGRADDAFAPTAYTPPPGVMDPLSVRAPLQGRAAADPSLLSDIPVPPTAAPAPVHMGSGLAPLSRTPAEPARVPGAPAVSAPPTPAAQPVSAVLAHGGPDLDAGTTFAVEVSEVMHDPELDEAVISFANADFAQCETALQRLTAPSGERAQHADTWLVLFDLYRATGQQQRFESLALDYAQQFGWSAPQWYSLPKLVADQLADEQLLPSSSGAHSVLSGDVGWVCPELIDIEAVARLRSQTLQMPLPWVFDWSSLRLIDPEAAMQLSTLFRLWSGQQLEMRWVAGDRLFQVLAESAPTGVRDADPAFWLTRLDGLRLANRPDQFDEAAIDYCVTYEVSPPSWERTRCVVHIGGHSLNTRTSPMSVISDVSTSYMDMGTASELSGAGGVEVAHVELSGQLIGDISGTLRKLHDEMGTATVVSVSCARLIRVDFIAAGDLLNWVLARRSESRAVQFVDTHRLLALFFGAMGINEHASVQVRKV